MAVIAEGRTPVAGRLRTAAWNTLLAAAGFVFLIGAALILGAQPIPAASVGGTTTVRIAIVDNGFHTDIALPADGETLAALGLASGDFPVDRSAVRYWGIGWGSQTAYTSLEAVSDLTPRIIARSIAFDRTVMHVAPWGDVEGEVGVRMLDLPRADYEQLLASIATSFAATDPIPHITQGFGDRFYRGRGRFTAWHGCNAWVGRRLREAGIGVGLWTPTAQSIGYGLDRIAGGSQS